MLDMDDPSEVIAASRDFARAVTSTTGRVSGMADDLDLEHRPDSALDHRAVHIRNLVVESFGSAVSARNGHTGTTDSQVHAAATAIGNGDTGGAAVVRSV